MIKHNQDGSSTTAALLGLTIVLLLGALGFGGWAFASRQDYKNNVDQKIDTATQVAVQKADSAKDAEFAEKEKSPYRTYNGPEAFGSVSVVYPKTWSAYVDDTGNGNALVDAYFAPGAVPSINAQASVFALRVQVLGQSYNQSLLSLTGLQQSGKITVSAYALPKVPKAVGVKAVGTFDNGQNGETIILPLRNQTLKIWTQGSTFTGDFEKAILPNFTFAP